MVYEFACPKAEAVRLLIELPAADLDQKEPLRVAVPAKLVEKLARPRR